MDYNVLIQLAEQCPGLQVSISLGDLVNAMRQLIAETKQELEQTIADSKAEAYLSREKTMETLDISSTTLWRWAQIGYLTPLNVGGKHRYRMSDIKRIMEGDNTQKGVAV